MPKFDNYVLYFKPTCPYCRKVLAYMDGAGIELDQRDVNDAKNADDLVRIGGKLQVPCLVIDGKAMYESDDIIAFLKEQLAA